jgi:hypothetical protein
MTWVSDSTKVPGSDSDKGSGKTKHVRQGDFFALGLNLNQDRVG